MRKKCFIGIMVALFVCFIATSCTKKDSGDTAQEDDFGLNFKAVRPQSDLEYRFKQVNHC